jgi:hypothetical protein
MISAPDSTATNHRRLPVSQPQPLIWLARSPASSCVDFGSGDRAITRLALANRLANLAPISLPNMLNRGGEIDTVIAVRIDDGLISGLYAVRNPREAVAHGAGDHPAPLSPSGP